MAAPKWMHESRAREEVYKSLPDKDSDQAWLWYGIGVAGKTLQKLQKGPWQLTPHDIFEQFGSEVYTGNCDFIWELRYWQDAQGSEGNTLDWPTVCQAIIDAKGDDSTWTSCHVKQAREALESNKLRKRKVREREESRVASAAKHVRHGIDTPPDSPRSPIKGFKEAALNKAASSAVNRSAVPSDSKTTNRSKRSSAQRASLMTSRLYRLFPSSNGPSRRRERMSISAMSPDKPPPDLAENDHGSEDSVQGDIAETMHKEATPPDPDNRDLYDAPGPALAPLSDPQVSADAPKPSPTQSVPAPEPSSSNTARNDRLQLKSTHLEPASIHCFNFQAPIDASVSLCSLPVSVPDVSTHPPMSVNPSESDSAQSYHQRIIADLHSPTSLSAETLNFFLRELLPTNTVRLFDPGNPPLGKDLTSWPQSPPRHLSNVEHLLIPLCVDRRWVLFGFDFRRTCVKITESFKAESDEDILFNIAARLIASIKLAGNSEKDISWNIQIDEETRPMHSARADFGIHMFILCLRIAAGTNDYPTETDTILWRVVLLKLIGNDSLGELLKDWLAKLRSEVTVQLCITDDPWLAESLPGFHATKLRLDTIPRLKRHITEALQSTLPDMERTMISLGHVASRWLQVVSSHIPVAETNATAFKQQMDSLLQSQSSDFHAGATGLSELAGSLEEYHRKQQGQVRKLEREKNRIRKMQDYFSAICDITRECKDRLQQFEKDLDKDTEASCADMFRVGKPEVNEQTRQLTDWKIELDQRERSLRGAREYIAQCEKDVIRNYIWR